ASGGQVVVERGDGPGLVPERDLPLRLGLRLGRLPFPHERAHLVEEALAVGHCLVGPGAVVVEPGAGHQVLEVAHGLLLLADALLEVRDARLELARLALPSLPVHRTRGPEPRGQRTVGALAAAVAGRGARGWPSPPHRRPAP